MIESADMIRYLSGKCIPFDNAGHGGKFSITVLRSPQHTACVAQMWHAVLGSQNTRPQSRLLGRQGQGFIRCICETAHTDYNAIVSNGELKGSSWLLSAVNILSLGISFTAVVP